jgi:ketosteroid isomerase-like protein
MSEKNVEVVHELYEHMARGEYSFPGGLVDDDVVFARHGQALGLLEGEWQGPDEIRDAVLDYLRSWEGLRNELEEVRDLGDQVLVFERQRGRGRASGAAMEREMASLFSLRDGRVVRWDSYWDPTDALAAAGLTE